MLEQGTFGDGPTFLFESSMLINYFISDIDTDRDEYFWDSDYWMEPYWQIMKCPDGFGWEGNFTHGHCEPCEPGHYSDEYAGLRTRCVPCSVGEYGKTCQWYCGDNTTFTTGAMAESDCVDPDDMFGEGSFQSEVTVVVKVTGDWTFLNPVLMEVSGINFYHARASVELHEGNYTSSIHVSAVLPNNMAVHAQNFLLELKDHAKSFLNDYVTLGDHYTRKIFDMLNNADTLKEFGWKMNHDQLKVDDVKILDVQVHLNQHCEHGYRSVEWEGVGTKCVEDTQAHSALEKSWYIQYVGESEDCDSLGGEARLRHFVEKNWPFPCLEDGECEAHFATCKTLMSGDCAIMIHLIFHDNEAGKGDMETNINKARRVEYHGNTLFEYSEDNPYESRENCGVDPKINGDGSTKCSEELKCDSENGYRLTRSGNCEQCPYGTWFDRESDETFQRCHSCSYYRSVTMMNNVPRSAQECINGGLFREQNSDGVWLDWSDEVEVELEYSGDVTVEMHLCRVIDVKHKFEEYCAERMSMEDMSLDDFTNFNVEMLGCLIMEEFSEIYEHSCEDHNIPETWSGVMDRYLSLKGVACFFAKGIHAIENKGNCDSLSDDEQRLSMPFEFDEENLEFLYQYEHFGWSSALWVPLISNVEKMNRFQMDSISETIEGVFRKFGMYDMARLTGLGMMDYVRDMILAVPRGLSVREANFELKTNYDDICDNGNERSTCSDNSTCESNRCNSKQHSEADLTCNLDPCDNCQPFWTYNGDRVECEADYRWKCDIDTDIENGRLIKMRKSYYYNDTGDEVPQVEYEYSCDVGFRLDNPDLTVYSSREIYCGTNEISCDPQENRFNRQPQCVRDRCDYDDLENGYIYDIKNYSDSACRRAEYRCNEGYDMVGSDQVYCNVNGSKTDMPRCVRNTTCQFSDDDAARFITEYNTWGGMRMGWYQCRNGTRRYSDVYYSKRCGEGERFCEFDTNCPVEIENGYLMREWEWEEYDTFIGEYRCYEGFELRNPSIFSTSKADYEEHYGWGACGRRYSYNGTTDPENLPRCVKPGTPEPCNMPRETLNGYRVEEIMNEEYGMVNQAKYKCNSGFMMVETWKGDIGWCRNDGTFELPYCMSPREWFTVEFELVPGFSKMENAGRVKARHVYADGSADDWYAGCDDHFNGPAAGAICRSMGFRHGKQITGDKKMKPISDLPFGMTNIYCYHDDTLIMR